MSVDRQFLSRRFSIGLARSVTLAQNVLGEWSFFDPAVNSSLFERFQRCRLRVGHSWFRIAFGKCPAPAAPRLDQQELNASAAHAIANSSDLFAFAQFTEVRECNEPG